MAKAAAAVAAMTEARVVEVATAAESASVEAVRAGGYAAAAVLSVVLMAAEVTLTAGEVVRLEERVAAVGTE
eukprot:1420875-Prymnesium_polylepis.1